MRFQRVLDIVHGVFNDLNIFTSPDYLVQNEKNSYGPHIHNFDHLFFPTKVPELTLENFW